MLTKRARADEDDLIRNLHMVSFWFACYACSASCSSSHSSSFADLPLGHRDELVTGATVKLANCKTRH